MAALVIAAAPGRRFGDLGAARHLGHAADRGDHGAVALLAHGHGPLDLHRVQIVAAGPEDEGDGGEGERRSVQLLTFHADLQRGEILALLAQDLHDVPGGAGARRGQQQLARGEPCRTSFMRAVDVYEVAVQAALRLEAVGVRLPGHEDRLHGLMMRPRRSGGWRGRPLGARR
jgi:hypothetical protein